MGRVNYLFKENVYLIIAITIISLSLLIDITGTEPNITGYVAGEIYSFGVPLNPEDETITTSTTTSTTEARTIITTSSTTEEVLLDSESFSSGGFFAQAVTEDFTFDFKDITSPSSTFNATNGTRGLDDLNYPPDPTDLTGTNVSEAPSDEYSNLSNSDNTGWYSRTATPAYGGNYRAFQIFKFEINQSREDILNASAKYEGYAATSSAYGAGTGYNFSIWNVTGGVWVSLNVSNANATDEQVERSLDYSWMNITDFIDQINGRNYTYLAVINNGSNATDASEANITTDYVSFTASVATTTSTTTSTTTTLEKSYFPLY
ncbi:MAG: hypothetical protein AABW46_02225, partial [Nanoarchaeota archaeon]